MIGPQIERITQIQFYLIRFTRNLRSKTPLHSLRGPFPLPLHSRRFVAFVVNLFLISLRTHISSPCWRIAYSFFSCPIAEIWKSRLIRVDLENDSQALILLDIGKRLQHEDHS